MAPPSAQQKRMVCWLGGSFAVMFTAFNVGQTFLTTLFPDYGFYALSVMYSSFAVGSILAPPIGSIVGLRRSIVLGATTYVLFLVAIVIQQPSLLLLASALNGLGGGLLWIHEGVWLTRVSQYGGTVGYFTGIFFTLFNINGVAGNAIALVAFAANMSVIAMMTVMVVVCSAGVVMMMFMQPAEAAAKSSMSSPPPSSTKPAANHPSFRTMLRDVVEVAKQRRTQLLMPYMLAQGLGLSFSFSVLPGLTNGSGPEIAWVFLSYGASSILFSYIWGAVFDRCGWQALVQGHAACNLTAYTLVLALSEGGADRRAHILTGFVFGIIDNASNSVSNMTITRCFTSAASSMFSLYRVCFCAGVAFGAAIASAVPYQVMCGLVLGEFALAVAAYRHLMLRELHIAVDGTDTSTDCELEQASPDTATASSEGSVSPAEPSLSLPSSSSSNAAGAGAHGGAEATLVDVFEQDES